AKLSEGAGDVPCESCLVIRSSFAPCDSSCADAIDSSNTGSFEPEEGSPKRGFRTSRSKIDRGSLVIVAVSRGNAAHDSGPWWIGLGNAVDRRRGEVRVVHGRRGGRQRAAVDDAPQLGGVALGRHHGAPSYRDEARDGGDDTRPALRLVDELRVPRQELVLDLAPAALDVGVLSLPKRRWSVGAAGRHGPLSSVGRSRLARAWGADRATPRFPWRPRSERRPGSPGTRRA